MKRILSNVIKEMLQEIPSDYLGFKLDLECIYEQCKYNAPEQIYHWDKTSNILKKHLSEPTHEWEWSILNIFTNIPIEELKKMK